MKTRREALVVGASALGVSTLFPGGAFAAAAARADADAGQVSKSQAEAWLRAYGTAWVQRDADAAASLFTPEAAYRDNAFQPPMVGRAAIRTYWATSVADQSNITFSSTVWTVDGNVAIAHWTAGFDAVKDKKPAKLDGVFRLTFEASPGAPVQCRELLEWWFFQG